MFRLRTLVLPIALTLAALVPQRAVAAVASESSSSDYTGNAITTAFPTGFRFLANTDLVVKTRPLSGSTWTTLTLGVHYTVSGAGASSGTVTMLVAPAAGTTIHIERDVLLTQTKSFRSAGTFSPGVHEDAFDKLTMATQQLSRQSSDVSASVTAEAAARAAADAALQSAIANIQVGVGGVAPVVATGSTTARTLSNRFAETYNVKDYGAIGDGVTDDTTAIQATIDAAGAAGGGQVRVPAGTYIVGSPLRVRNDGVRIVGDSRHNTTLQKKTGTAGWLMVIAPEPVAFPGVTSLATGSGVAMNFDSTSTDWLNLTSDSDMGASLDGRSTFTIEFFYKPTGPIAEIRSLVSASNKSFSGIAAHESLVMRVNVDGSMTIAVDIAGTAKTCSSAAGAIVAGVTRHIALSYDNTNIRLFIGGVQQCSVAATGAVRQPVLDDLVVGPYTWEYLDNSGVFAGPRGAMDSIHVQAYPFYTANFTPPTTKATSNFSTLALINFDSISGMLIGGISSLGGTKATKFLWHSNRDATTFGSGGAAHSYVEHLYFSSGGIFTRCAIGLHFSDLQFVFAHISLALTNNSFLSTMEHLESTGAGAASINYVNTSASGVNTWNHVNGQVAAYNMWIRNSGVELDHVFLSSALKIPLVLLGAGGSTMTAVMSFVAITDEADPGMETDMLVDSVVSVKASASVFEAFVNAVPNVKVIGDSTVFFSGSVFTAKTGATERISFLTTRTKPVIVQEPTGSVLDDPTVPWNISQPSMVVLQLQGSYTKTRLIDFDPQALTVADNGGGTPAAGTLTPTRGVARITCSDADGCNITLSETGAVDGSFVTVTNVSANVCNFADTSGVTELAGAFAMGQWDSLTLEYVTDRWVERGRSNN